MSQRVPLYMQTLNTPAAPCNEQTLAQAFSNYLDTALSPHTRTHKLNMPLPSTHAHIITGSPATTETTTQYSVHLISIQLTSH